MLHSFCISHVNIRSLNKNFDNLNLLYEDTLKTKFDTIALSEVWNVSNKGILGLNDYVLEVKCRTGGTRGGGVGAYIHSSLKYVILDHEVTHTESLWLETDLNGRKITVGIIYRKPNTDIDQFQNSLLVTLERFKN